MILPDKKANNIQLLPDIDDYLESIDNNIPVSCKGIENIVDEVSARTKLTKEQSQIVVRLIFQEMRNSLLRGLKITLRKLGKFEISSPISGTKKRVFAKFTPSKKLVKELNDRYKGT